MCTQNVCTDAGRQAELVFWDSLAGHFFVEKKAAVLANPIRYHSEL
ncbi:MAG: hypothetical protein UY18_C0023G0002 [Microgenomates group bacterium GW2011_GWF2_47_9]|nr:MAG: hypothetical protein UY18_C0023G0002 [Microgenomates group bacterium GW2011_GWF2_47_9]